LKSAQQGPSYLGDLSMSSPLRQLDQSLLTRDALLGFQHTSSCHFQGGIICYQAPCIAAWRRRQPLAFTDAHSFAGWRAEDVQQFVSPRCGCMVSRRMFGSSQHVNLPLPEAREFQAARAAALT
jgi:hypothetical protein